MEKQFTEKQILVTWAATDWYNFNYISESVGSKLIMFSVPLESCDAAWVFRQWVIWKALKAGVPRVDRMNWKLQP